MVLSYLLGRLRACVWSLLRLHRLEDDDSRGPLRDCLHTPAAACQEPSKSVNPATTPEISKQELAKLLGNSISSAEIAATEEIDEQLQEEGSSTKDQAMFHLQKGQAFLDILRGTDSEEAAAACRQVKKEVVNIKDDCVGSALHLAASEGHVEACFELLKREDFLGVNARNFTGCTALHIAAGNDEVEIVQAILACPRFTSGVNAQNDFGQSALDFAMEFGQGFASKVLQDIGGQSCRLRRRERQGGEHRIPRSSEFDASANSEEIQDMNELD